MSRHSAPVGSVDPTFTSRSRSTAEILRRVAVYLRPYYWLALANIGCALLSVGFGLTYPRLTQFVIDSVIVGRRPEWLAPAMIGLLAAFLFRDIFNGLRIRVNNVFEQNVIYDMRCEVYGHLQHLPVGYFDQRASGDLMTRVIEDINSVERVLIDGTEQGTVALVSVVGVGVILFVTQPVLAAVALIPLPLLAAGALWYTLTAHRRYRAQRRAASAMNALLMDNLQGVRQIKIFNRQSHEQERFSGRANDLRDGTLQVMRAWSIYSPGMSFAAALGIGLVLWVGGGFVMNGELTLGELVAFNLYLTLFYEPIARLHGLNQMLQAARAAGERVFDILDASAEGGSTQGAGDRSPESGVRSQRLNQPVRGEVVYEQVAFGYAEGRSAIKGVSLRAEPGQMIALVGPTGAGKSTLVNLLTGFYEANSGRILIDGQDISRVLLQDLRDQISVVSQEAFLFNGTVRENILYGRLGASPEEMMAAARAANCHEFITHLPEGYDSRVGERGVKLSVGEKQRISIARALLKNAPILILDEATASVDTATEGLIQEALQRLMADRTSFVIAHRLSTIRRADQILVVRQGEIVERGTHEQLLNSEGLYSKLARIQNTTFIEESFERLEASQTS